MPYFIDGTVLSHLINYQENSNFHFYCNINHSKKIVSLLSIFFKTGFETMSEVKSIIKPHFHRLFRSFLYPSLYPTFFELKRSETYFPEGSRSPLLLRSAQNRVSSFHFDRCLANVPRTFSTPEPRAPLPKTRVFSVFTSSIHFKLMNERSDKAYALSDLSLWT